MTSTLNSKYWLIILILNFVPVFIIQKILGLFWTTDSAGNTHLAILNLMFTVGIVPIILLILNYNISKKFLQTHFIVNGVFICCAVFLSSYLGFLNWADSIGDRDYPDQETLGVISFERFSGITLTIIGTAIGQFHLNRKKNNTNS